MTYFYLLQCFVVFHMGFRPPVVLAGIYTLPIDIMLTFPGVSGRHFNMLALVGICGVVCEGLQVLPCIGDPPGTSAPDKCSSFSQIK